MPTSPADLRALAARCCAGETSDELRDAVLIALGWTTRMEWNGTFWVRPDGRKCTSGTPNPLTDLNASAAAMPAGWRMRIYAMDEVCIFAWSEAACTSIEACAPTERHARTAAALMARAAELEQKETADG
jgi:hypothetical protein